jgi:hypothetical protein
MGKTPSRQSAMENFYGFVARIEVGVTMMTEASAVRANASSDKSPPVPSPDDAQQSVGQRSA